MGCLKLSYKEKNYKALKVVYSNLYGNQKGCAGAYRFGFNGKENDNEVKGQGAQQDYGMRIYDPRLGRFLSVDPIAKQYPELTPYQFASNTPIQAIDLDGLEAGYLFKASGYSPKTDSKKLIEDGGNIVKDFALKVGELYVNALLMMTGEGAGAAVGEKAILGAVERKVIAAEVGAAKLEIQTAGEVKQVLDSDASEVVITKVGKTRTGETRVKALQGEKELDITKERVKEYKPEPKAKTGKRQVDFKKEGYPDGSNPHPKGDTKKRTPTTDEKKMVDDNTPKK